MRNQHEDGSRIPETKHTGSDDDEVGNLKGDGCRGVILEAEGMHIGSL